MFAVCRRFATLRSGFLFGLLSLGVGTYGCSESMIQPDVPNANPDGGGTADVDGGGGSPDMGTDMVIEEPMEVQLTETPVPANYWPLGVSQGVADPELNFRALITFPIRNQNALAARIASIYDPASSQFRRYLTPAEFMASYAPPQEDVDAVSSWLMSQGFKIEHTAKNRLIIHYSGTIAQWNAAFGATLHHMKRSQTTVRDWSYAPVTAVDVPQPLIGKIKRLLMPDVNDEQPPLSKDTAPILTTPPAGVESKLVPSQIASAYGMSDLYAKGYKGAGMTIGVVGATMYRQSDIQSMWQTFGITRKNPTVVEPMEPMYTRGLETALDIQLAGAMAPEAEVIFYGGPNTSDTTLVYTFNEAVGDAKAQVLSDSFAHAEANTPAPVARAYNESAMVAAALGITVVSAAGDSNQVDVPSDSPYVTAVGGTNIELNPDGSWKSEQSWELGGCGRSKVFAQPSWQAGSYAKANGQRTVADVGVVVGPSWVKFLGNWTYADGTSGSTPVLAALLTLVNQSRQVQGKPPVGFINSLIYQHPATRAAFRDIVTRGIDGCATAVGYDLATGIGSPKAAELAVAIP